jgi:hypothetical protein
MNKSRLITGLICLAVAGILAVVNLRLPADKLMFTVGDANMPWVPPVVLAIVGMIFLVSALAGTSPAPVAAKAATAPDPDKAALNKRLETMAWGSFLILLGGFMFIPNEIIRGGWWSIGVGLIMLGLNAARYFNGLKMSGFTTVLGVLSLIGGALDLVSSYDLDGAVLLIVLGAYLLVKPYLDRRQLFGKAEEA